MTIINKLPYLVFLIYLYDQVITKLTKRFYRETEKK